MFEKILSCKMLQLEVSIHIIMLCLIHVMSNLSKHGYNPFINCVEISRYNVTHALIMLIVLTCLICLIQKIKS